MVFEFPAGRVRAGRRAYPETDNRRCGPAVGVKQTGPAVSNPYLPAARDRTAPGTRVAYPPAASVAWQISATPFLSERI